MRSDEATGGGGAQVSMGLGVGGAPFFPISEPGPGWFGRGLRKRRRTSKRRIITSFSHHFSAATDELKHLVRERKLIILSFVFVDVTN